MRRAHGAGLVRGGVGSAGFGDHAQGHPTGAAERLAQHVGRRLRGACVDVCICVCL
ncbi:hypothetical protein GM547_13605, partial [Streptococcus pneumoniae]|nr:hypothetical protein [Streptococcus pneumoniae]